MAPVRFVNLRGIPEDNCCICFEPISEEDGAGHVTDQKVKHIFHTRCITECVEEFPHCPLCKRIIIEIHG